MIVIGRRILRGALRGIEEGTNFISTYQVFGQSLLEDNFLSKTTYDMMCYLEENACEAVPLFGYNHEGDLSYGTPVSPDKPAPNVIIDMEFAAIQCGLGEMGKGGFFLTPEYGTRQRLAAILTDVEFNADPIREFDFCNDCNACIDACPLNAYKDNKFDPIVCKSCKNGAIVTQGRGGVIDRIAASCGRGCLISLEKRNKLTNKFNNSFRKRKPWALDMYGRNIELDS